eukprot:9521751-Alexandrium_andersonii.AAC.1
MPELRSPVTELRNHAGALQSADARRPGSEPRLRNASAGLDPEAPEAVQSGLGSARGPKLKEAQRLGSKGAR